MATTIVDSLKELVSNFGKPLSGIEEESNKARDNFKELLQNALDSENFTVKSRVGNPLTKADKEVKQRIRKYLWFLGESNSEKEPAVSLSGFLTNYEGKPVIRLSVEIRVAPGKWTHDTDKKDKKSERFFESRKQYESMLELPLADGLSYFYNGRFEDNVNQNVVDEFISDPKSTAHIEVVKKIDLSCLDDDALKKEMTDGITALMPYYRKASGTDANQVPPAAKTIPSYEWHPSVEEYNPNITKEQWLSFLKDHNNISDEDPFWANILAGFYRHKEDGATCQEIGIEYNQDWQSIRAGIVQLGKRVQRVFGCPLSGNSFWPIMFVGRPVTEKGRKGSFIYKLRPELYDALTEFDITKYEWKKDSTTPFVDMPKNIILFGPPGTGKTYHSIAYAMGILYQGKADTSDKGNQILSKLLNHETINDYEPIKQAFDGEKIEYDSDGKVNKGHIAFTTFHQSYSYEDFIEGIFPSADKEGKIAYKLRPGVFKSLCDYAKQEAHEHENYVIIIDEINRGNISKVFGDLITLVEEDKRLDGNNELTAILPYSRESWGIPSNVYIIGTMNTADRSIERIDTALRRRFDFIEMMPNPSLLSGYKKIMDSSDGRKVSLSLDELLTTMNERISFLYDREHQIGHSYFLSIDCNEGVYDINDLAKVFRNKIIPLLQEYFYDDYEKIREVLGEDDSDKSDDTDIIQIKEMPDSVRNIITSDDDQETYVVNSGAFNRIDTYLKIVAEGGQQDEGNQNS